ncbi:PREDICTED: uncharacterized protein LOC109127739 [Camelina sativa]|uniref:Uncharacterized protein LOC109127739 n=1 Tax=Camelina sativa TaxID=90675 RepID=A0ABM1QPY4_CAMSA|nr:PREDICTED: uncharacterized protein LOC109127739 [Camelina sativa]
MVMHVPRRSNRLTTPSFSTITPYKAPRNPATSAIHPKFNPFLSPTFHDIEELNSWKSSNIRPGVITDTEPLTSHWLNFLGRPDTNLQETHIDAALELLWLRRDQDPIYFYNKRLLKTTFVRPDYFSKLKAAYFNFKKDNFKSQYVFPEEVTDIVSGKLPSVCLSTKKWKDLDRVYGIAYNSTYKQYIGMEISFKFRKITFFLLSN